MSRSTCAIGVLLWTVSGVACSERQPRNPSLPWTVDEASQLLDAIEQCPVPLERPVVVLTGYLDPGLGSTWTASLVRGWATEGERVLPISFLTCFTFDSARERVIAAVDEAFPWDHPLWTREVDVIAMSMGGLIARYAAAPVHGDGGPLRRLAIARLFSISTPHVGAKMAWLPFPHPMQLDMRHGSAFLERLERLEGQRDYPIFPYVLLGDWIVGAENAAPRGQEPFWAADRWWSLSHYVANTDPRILGDIARRLRGEPPLTVFPPTPLPP